MADTKRPKKVILRTPAGVARYPKLFVPDTKFNKDGVYSVSLILKGADAATLAEAIDKGITESVKDATADPKNKGKKIKKADAPYSAVTDEDGNETGETKFSFKMRASGKKKDGQPWTRRPTVFDSKGKPISKDVRVGGGTTMKVAYELSKFYTPLVGAGVSLRLEAVQIINLVEWSGGDAKSYGFDEEDGYDSAGAAADETGDKTPEAAADATPDSETEF